MTTSSDSSRAKSGPDGTGSASEVIRAGLRLLEVRETEMSALREALASGEASGQAEPFDFDAFIAAKAARTS